jgi:hypothetical protein
MSDRATLNGLLLAKLETTEGTDAAPAAATDAIQIMGWFDPSGDAKFQKSRDMAMVGNSFQGAAPLKPTGYIGTWSHPTIYFRGPRNGLLISTVNLPDFDMFMQSAGCSDTIVATGGLESVTWKPISTAIKSITEKFYVDGKLRSILGAKSDINFSIEAGGPLELAVSTTGLYQQDADIAMPTGAAFGTTDPPIADSTLTFTIGGFTAGVFRKFSWGMGNKVESGRGSLNAATGGLAVPKIRDRKIPFSVTFEEELVATIDVEGWRKANTGLVLSWTLGTVQYNKANFAAPNAHVEKVQVADDAGTQVITVSGFLWDSAPGANDAFSLKNF